MMVLFRRSVTPEDIWNWHISAWFAIAVAYIGFEAVCIASDTTLLMLLFQAIGLILHLPVRTLTPPIRAFNFALDGGIVMTIIGLGYHFKPLSPVGIPTIVGYEPPIQGQAVPFQLVPQLETQPPEPPQPPQQSPETYIEHEQPGDRLYNLSVDLMNNAFHTGLDTLQPPFPGCSVFYANHLEEVPDFAGRLSGFLAAVRSQTDPVFEPVKATLDENQRLLDRKHLGIMAIRAGEHVSPGDYEASNIQMLKDFTRGTLYEKMWANTYVDIFPPKELRTQHTVIIGRTGAGKTQLLEKMIFNDLSDPEKPSVIVIDSKNDLVPRIARLSMFQPLNGSEFERLAIIDHHDKPALNLFDFPGKIDQDRVNRIASSMRYFFSGLLKEELSPQMNTIFTSLLHVLLRVKGATLSDFQKLVRNPKLYPEAFEQIPPNIKTFLEGEFNADSYRTTKQSIITRLQGIITEVSLDEMFSGSHNAVHLEDAVEEGKVVLINTDRDGLQDLSPIFGKFWISLTLNAIRARGSGNYQRRPVYLYIDECAPYVDEKIQELFTTIRSYGGGVTAAFQDTHQMGSYQRAIRGMSAIKFVSNPVEEDVEGAAAFLNATPEFVKAQVRTKTHGRFGLYWEGRQRPVSVMFRFGELDRHFMSAQDYGWLRQLNAETLKSHPKPEPTPTPAKKPEPPSTPDSSLTI